MPSDDLVQDVALIKLVEDEIKTRKALVAAALSEQMAPGDMVRRSDITVSMSKGSATTAMVVDDPRAYLEWVKAHRPDAVVEVPAREEVAEWLLAELAQSGELPNGVEVVEKTRAPALSVRQSQAQKDELLGLIRSGQVRLGRVLGIEA